MEAALAASGSSRPRLSSAKRSAVAWGPGDHNILNLGKCIVKSCNLWTKSEEPILGKKG